jgi:hypothetical protein
MTITILQNNGRESEVVGMIPISAAVRDPRKYIKFLFSDKELAVDSCNPSRKPWAPVLLLSVS